MELKDESHVLVSKRHQLHIAEGAELDVANLHAAAVALVQASQHVQQRALADAGGSHDRQHLSAFGTQIEAAQHGQLPVADNVALVKVLDLDERQAISLDTLKGPRDKPDARRLATKTQDTRQAASRRAGVVTRSIVRIDTLIGI